MINMERKKIFEGFGTQIPQEIVEATSIRKVPLDSGQTSSVNIGEQLEGPFLLSEKKLYKSQCNW